jgi:VanZ family protein
MRNNQRFMWLAPYVFWGLMCIVTVLLLIELAPSHSSWPYKDKLEHISAFALLGLSGYLSYPRKAVWIYSGLILYGLYMEWMQTTFTASRTGSIYDWVADIVGVLLSAFTIYLFTKNNANRI